jgi:1-acyl-sn-glycerol-3-phosphate acyltransferase
LRPNTIPWFVGKIVLTILFYGYFRMTVEGEENVPSQGPLLLVSNHVSNLDPFAIGIALHRRVDFLSKQENFKIPLLSYFIRAWGAIPLNRRASDASAMRAAVRTIKEGRMLGIFPEGTRSTTGELQGFREGVARIALHFQIPIMPVAIIGAHAALPRGAWLPKPVPIKLRFGRPFDLSQFAGQAATQPVLEAAAQVIRSHVLALLEGEETVSAPSVPRT